jgi:hypothetical protein
MGTADTLVENKITPMYVETSRQLTYPYTIPRHEAPQLMLASNRNGKPSLWQRKETPNTSS